MEGIVIFKAKDEVVKNMPTYSTFLAEDPFGNRIYQVYIEIDPSKTFKSYVDKSQRVELLKSFRSYINISETFKGDTTQEDLKDFRNLMQTYAGRELDIVHDAKYISFSNDFELDFIKEYIKSNPELRNKSLILDWSLNMGSTALRELECLRAHVGEICISFQENSALVTVEEAIKTIEAIENIVNHIKSLGLSPMEQIMYAYDLVRDRVYTKESAGESFTVSRDLTATLLGDKIVCYGYANILDSILEQLGIKSMMYKIKNIREDNFHEVLIADVEDEKYGISGIYYFDLTTDSRKDDTRNFLYSYRYFAMTKAHFDEKIAGKYEDVTFGRLDDEYISAFKRVVTEKGIKNVDERTVTYLNRVSVFINEKGLIPKVNLIDNLRLPAFLRKTFDKEATFDELDSCLAHFQKAIAPETLLKIVFEVRKLQYYQNRELYPFGLLPFINILANIPIEIQKSDAERLFEALFENVPKKISVQKYRDYLRDRELDKDILRIQATRLLRDVLESSEQNEIDSKTKC